MAPISIEYHFRGF